MEKLTSLCHIYKYYITAEKVVESFMEQACGRGISVRLIDAQHFIIVKEYIDFSEFAEEMSESYGSWERTAITTYAGDSLDNYLKYREQKAKPPEQKVHEGKITTDLIDI